MKALTKGQYEVIASVLARGMEATAYVFAEWLQEQEQLKKINDKV